MRSQRKFQIKDGNTGKSKESKEPQKWEIKEVEKCGHQGRRGKKLEQKKDAVRSQGQLQGHLSE